MGSSHSPDPSPAIDTPAACDEEYSLPCAEAVLAGTLALMTGHAQTGCGSHRDAMARKIMVSLQQLAQGDGFTPHFRALLGSLQRRWAQQCGLAPAQTPSAAALSVAEQRRALWLTAPKTLQ